MCVTGLIAGTLASSAIGASSANKAAKAQTAAADSANAVQLQIHEDNMAAQAPWLEGGEIGLNALMYELGLGEAPTYGGTMPEIIELTGQGAGQGAFSSPLSQTGYQVGDQIFSTREDAEAYANDNRTDVETYAGYEASPGYQFQLSEGMNALEKSAAARGLRLSGAALQEGQAYVQGLASSDRANYLNQLAGLAGVGQTATAQTQASGTNYANAFGQNALTAGSAQASGYANTNNAFQSGLNNAFSIYGMNQAGYFA